MKKSILAILTTIPFLVCCNKNSKGFVDPFPDDPYDKDKIGFNIADDEKITRPLLSSELDLIKSTIDRISDIDPKLKETEKSEIHERDYTRAFAGEFKKGYSASNMMYDEYIENSFYQEKSSTPKRYLRSWKKSDISLTMDYSYGRNVTQLTDAKTIRFCAGEPADSKYTEDDNGRNVLDIIRVNNDETISASIVAQNVPDEKDINEYFLTGQSNYIFTPGASDPMPGADNEGRVILVRETHLPYNGTGEYELPDGRKYRAMENSILVSRLIRVTDIIDSPCYLVEYARRYTETAITSDVIQPNVPISYLANPIVVNYKEEKHFLTQKVVSDVSDELQFVDVEVQE